MPAAAAPVRHTAAQAPRVATPPATQPTGARDDRARPLPVRPLRTPDNPHGWTVSAVRRRSTVVQSMPSYMRFLAGRLLAATRNSKAPLLDLFLQSFVTRVDERWRKNRAPLGVRFALGFPVPHILVRAQTPFATRTLRLPFTS